MWELDQNVIVRSRNRDLTLTFSDILYLEIIFLAMCWCRVKKLIVRKVDVAATAHVRLRLLGLGLVFGLWLHHHHR